MGTFVNVDLHELYNHKVFIEKKDDMHLTGLTNQGLGASSEFIVSTEYPNSTETILIENVPFIFPEISINKYDNVQCTEQIISLPEGTYKKIHFLGFGTNTSYQDVAFLKYKGEVCEEISISFIGLGVAGTRKFVTNSSGFKFIDEIITQEKAVLFGKNTKGTDLACTYWKVYLENDKEILSEIKLPDNSFMRILAITLET